MGRPASLGCWYVSRHVGEWRRGDGISSVASSALTNQHPGLLPLAQRVAAMAVARSRRRCLAVCTHVGGNVL